MSPLKIGSRDIKAVRIGSRDIIRIMHGTREIWAAEDEPGGGWGDCLEQGIAAFTVNSGSTGAQEGYRFTVGASDIRVCSFLHRNPASNTGSEVTLRLWAADGQTLLASKAHTPGASGDAWQEIPLDEPIVLEAGKTYAVTGRSTTGANISRRYAFTSSVTRHAALATLTGVTVSGDGYPTSTQSWFRLVDIVFAMPA